MKKSWHVWAAFALCLAVGLLGMSWLTVRAIDLDQAEASARSEADRARQQTELQERIATALWRMDWTLAPLIAQEATRPSFVYRPFLRTPTGKGGGTAVASPLLTQAPDYVILNFDVSAENGWTSPQNPTGVHVPYANAAGLSNDAISENRVKLQQLGGSISFDELLALLPDALMPSTIQTVDNAAEAQQAQVDTGSIASYGQQPANQQDGGEQQQAEPGPQQALTQQQRYTLPNNSAQGMAQQQVLQPQSGFDSQSTFPLSQSRAQQEWYRRNLGMQNVARSQREQIISNAMFLPPETTEREGVSRPIWIGETLILARRVVSEGDVRVQGCWLDWQHIKGRLEEEVADLFPQIDLLPVTDDQTVPPGRLLATLPVQLVVPASASDLADVGSSGTSNLSAIRISLMIAWCCLLLGSVAVAVMLRGVLALSERRASFVSAVTHELRSPLTTFRMYAEMLSEGMVRDEQQRQRYLDTLRQEADRLSHLVDNVLQYARLERGRRTRRRVDIAMKDLMQQTTERLPQRARQAGMELHETIAPPDATKMVHTDPSAVEQILFNLVDNSCKYASRAEDRRIHLHWAVGNGVAQVRVTDHGPGIGPDQAAKLFRPFSKSDQEAAQSAPGIGLGLALCRRLATEIGGKLHFDAGGSDGAAFLLEIPLM